MKFPTISIDALLSVLAVSVFAMVLSLTASKNAMANCNAKPCVQIQADGSAVVGRVINGACVVRDAKDGSSQR